MAGARLFRLPAYVVLTSIVFGTDTDLRAQTCRHDAANERLAKGGRQGSDGKVHSIDDYADWVDSKQEPQGAIVIMAHELGHFLGLEEENPAVNSIVAQHDGSCRSYAANPRVRTPTKRDAEVVRDCIKKHRAAAGKK